MGCCFSGLRSPECLYTDLSLKFWDKVKARFNEEEPFGPFDPHQLFPQSIEPPLDPPLRLTQNGDTLLTLVMHYIHPLYFNNRKHGERFHGRMILDFEKEPIEFTKRIFEKAQEAHSNGIIGNIAAEKSTGTGCYPAHYSFKLVDLDLARAIRDAYPDALSVKCERDPLDEYDHMDFQEMPPAKATPYELALFYGHRYQEGMGAVEELLKILDYEGNPHTDEDGNPLVKPRVYETWQHLIDHKAYDEVRKWLNYTNSSFGRDAVPRYDFVESNMEETRVSQERMDMIHHVDIQGRTPLHCCFRKGGMTSEDVEIANIILDISDQDDFVGYRRDFYQNICYFKDARDNLPLTLAAMYCQDEQLIQRLIDKYPLAVEERCGKPFGMTPYEHMTDHFGDANRGGWDNDQKLRMVQLLDFESNNSRWEMPVAVVEEEHWKEENIPDEAPEVEAPAEEAPEEEAPAEEAPEEEAPVQE